jgi:hypothetical protein
MNGLDCYILPAASAIFGLMQKGIYLSGHLLSSRCCDCYHSLLCRTNPVTTLGYKTWEWLLIWIHRWRNPLSWMTVMAWNRTKWAAVRASWHSHFRVASCWALTLAFPRERTLPTAYRIRSHNYRNTYFVVGVDLQPTRNSLPMSSDTIFLNSGKGQLCTLSLFFFLVLIMVCK